MKIKILEIVAASQVLAHLANQKIKDQKVFFWVTVTTRKLADSLEAYEKTRNNLIMEYGTPDPENPGSYKLTVGENRIKFNQTITDILETEEEHNINTIKLSRLYAASNDETRPLDILPEQIVALGPLVEYDMESLNESS